MKQKSGEPFSPTEASRRVFFYRICTVYVIKVEIPSKRPRQQGHFLLSNVTLITFENRGGGIINVAAPGPEGGNR
jgi:hypothetical protein